jgi:predicted Zn finger-like uncharacterized protein
MANIRVTCPTCESELEIDEVFAGQEVECGSCGHVFVARERSGATGRTDLPIPGAGPASSRRSEPRERDEPDKRDDEPEEPPRERRPLPPPPRRPEQRRRDEEDGRQSPDRYEYEDDDYAAPPERRANTGNGLAVASLVLGLLSVAMVVLTLPFACCCAFLPLPFTLPLSLAATVTGALGLRGDADRQPLAVAGLVLGVLCLGFAALQLAFGIIPKMNAVR